MNSKNIKQRIKEEYEGLSPACQKVAKFVIDNYQQSMLLSSSELAEAAKVSHTAVIRYTKALGFSGFLEYRNSLKTEYTSTQKVYSYLNMMQPDDQGGYIGEYLNALRGDFDTFTKNLNQASLDAFCSTILKAETVYIMGIGSDSVIIDFLKNYLNVMGIKVVPVYEEGLTLREKLFLLSSKDVLLLAAYPTLMEDERWASDYALSKGADLLVLTDSEITAKTLRATQYINVLESSDTFFNSYVLPMTFCNLLLLRLYELAPEKTAKAMKEYQDMLQ